MGCSSTTAQSDATSGAAAHVRADSFSREEFSADHAEIKVHLGHVDAMATQLPSAPPSEQRQTMRAIAAFFEEHILSHAADEERTLYPRADAIAGDRFTQSMRYEHSVVGAWVREIREISEGPDPDIQAFARRTQRLLGLLEAHFGAEEEVVVPVIAGE